MPTDLTPQDFEEMASKAVKNAEKKSQTTSDKRDSRQENKVDQEVSNRVEGLLVETIQNCSQDTQSEVAEELSKLTERIFSEDREK